MHVMHTERIGLFGATGYAGVELTALLAHHPHARLAFAASESASSTGGGTIEEASGISGSAGRLGYVGYAEAMDLAAGCAAVLLATPAEVSLTLAPRLLSLGCRVIDLSGAFRLDGDTFAQAYGLDSAAKELLARSTWGLPELARAAIVKAEIIANPGCYPTAAVLGLGPLLRAGLVSPDDIVVDALSGVSGAGRRSRDASSAYSFMDVHADVRPYKVLAHQHTPEISQGLTRFAGKPVSVTFTPHLIPIARGILCTSYARLHASATSADLTQALTAAYRGERFVRVASGPDAVSLRHVVGTNECLVGVACEPRAGGRVVAVSAIDNLIKGAAGQAMQNLNLALGWEEHAGLTHLRRWHS